MKTTTDLIELAKTLIGRPYVLGAIVPADNPNYSGPFDCAEFVKWLNYQIFGIIYGCDSDSLTHAHTADGYTGYFERDAKALGRIISVQEAITIPGAMILRFPAPGAVGHIVLSQGTGKTVEANCTKYGCIESVTNNRRFDIGVLLPGVQYNMSYHPVISSAPEIVYRYKTPNMINPFVGEIQKALGFSQDDQDNIFGNKTLKAVIAFQTKEGLIIDGEVMPGGETAKHLNI
jgi:putative peptidoglycan binding protein